MSCPENELAHKISISHGCFHKSSFSISSFCDVFEHKGVTKWLPSHYHFVGHNKIGSRRENFYRKRLLEYKKNIWRLYQWHQASNICLIAMQIMILLTHVSHCDDLVTHSQGSHACRDFRKKSGIVICDSRPGNSREFHLFSLEFGKMRASEFFLTLKWRVMYFWQSPDASLAYLQARM